MDSARKRVRASALLGALILLGPWSHSLAADRSRFSLSGSGTLSTDPPAQASDRWQLKASFSPAADAPAWQAQGRFVLTGALSASSLACYADTIFRDSFDGTGL